MKIKAFLLTTFFVSTVCSYAQNDFLKIGSKKIDSLIILLPNYPKKDTNRLNALLRIIDAAMFLSQKKKVYPYYEEYKALAQQLNNLPAIGRSLFFKSNYLRSELKYDSSHVVLDSLIQLSQNKEDVSMKYIFFIANADKAHLYYFKENYFQAIKHAQIAEEYLVKSNNSRMFNNLKIISSSYKNVENYESALKVLQKQNQLSKASSDLIGDPYLDIADIYITRNDITAAKKALDSLVLVMPMPDTVQLLVTHAYYEKKGLIAVAEKNYDEAGGYFEKGIFFAKKSEHLFAINALSLLNIKNEILKKDFTKALLLSNQLDSNIHKEANKNHFAVHYKNLSEIYAALNQPPKAYSFLLKAMNYNDSVLNEKNIKQINTLANVFENSKKEEAIKRLESEKEKKNNQLAKRKNTIVYLIASLAMLSLASMLMFKNFQHRKKLQQQKITELEKEKQLQAVDAMLQGQEEERSRLAKDLHDGLGGMLSGVKLSFNNMKENMILDADNTQRFEKSINQLDNTIAELRKVAHNLMPESLSKLGLKTAIEDYCSSLQSSSGCSIIYQQMGNNIELSTIASVNIYRIIQELVNNAVKHAQPKQILVQLTKTANKVLISAEDDGKGFDTNVLKNSKGIGISNITNRVQYLNGTIDIQSTPGKGTAFNIELNV
jgi:two-component system, NarL family, sensor kinase